MKDLVQAKTRLSGVLAPSERRALAQAMAEDVLAALVNCDGLEGVLLLSDDPGAHLLAHQYDVALLPESALAVSGLNAVVAAGCRVLRDRGADTVMIVHSDLPLLTSADLDRIRAHREAAAADLVISPDRHGEGTNILLAGTDRLPAFHYGRDSCRLHLEAARARNLEASVLALPGAGFDVDEPGDLIDLWCRLREGSHIGARSAEFLASPEVARRLEALAGSLQDRRRGQS